MVGFGLNIIYVEVEIGFGVLNMLVGIVVGLVLIVEVLGIILFMFIFGNLLFSMEGDDWGYGWNVGIFW